jgi:pimeloyl-ACP methyl ester carboxylesterase
MRVEIGGGVRLFVDVVGSSLEPTHDEMRPKPTLLLLHGGPGLDHSAFRPYFDRFADSHQVVY